MATNTTETANEAATELESEVALVENAYAYLTGKKYPNSCSKNEKRSIRTIITNTCMFVCACVCVCTRAMCSLTLSRLNHVTLARELAGNSARQPQSSTRYQWSHHGITSA